MLNLLPFRDWLYLGAILAIVAGFITYTAHERHIGAAALAQKEAAIAHAQELHNIEVETRAKTLADAALADYAAAHAVPIAPATPLVCYHARPSPVPSTPGTSSGGNGGTRVPEEAEGPPYDPSPAVLADGRDADAQVALLQALIRSYQAAGVVAK